MGIRLERDMGREKERERELKVSGRGSRRDRERGGKGVVTGRERR